MLNKTGKTLTIFVVLTIVLLVSSTSIGFFLYHKEERLYNTTQSDLNASRDNEAKLQGQLKEIQKQLGILQDKNKEADAKINNLLDQIDLDQGVRDALKKENTGLKDQLDASNKTKDKIKTDLDNANTQMQQLQDLLKTEQDKSKDFQDRISKLEALKTTVQAKIDAGAAPASTATAAGTPAGTVPLEKIIVNPQGGPKGIVLTVDQDAAFVIFNLGAQQGVKSGDLLSVYHGNDYVGDIKATRVQDKLSAADLVAPLSSNQLQKNDSVVLKP